MATRIIPGAISTSSARALMITDEKSAPALRVEPVAGGAARPAKVRELDAGDPIVDQHIRRAGLQLFLGEIDGLSPGTDYHLRVGTAAPVHVRTFPAQLPKEGLSFALASCYYEAFGRDKDYLKALHAAAPGFGPLAAKLLVGDNVYIDVGKSPTAQRSGAEETIGRYLQYYWRSGYADVLSFLPSFFLWDDHELWVGSL